VPDTDFLRIFADPWYALAKLQEDEAARQRQSTFADMLNTDWLGTAVSRGVENVGRERAQNTIDIARRYPDAPPEWVTAAGAAGATADDFATYMVMRQRVERGDNIPTRIAKGIVRTGIVGADAIWESLFAIPARTIAGTLGIGNAGPMNLVDAFRAAGAPIASGILREQLHGRPVNLGTGWTPYGATIPEDTQEYAQLVRNGVSPEEASRTVQEQIGIPIGPLTVRQRETGITIGAGSASPGRIVASLVPFLEPDTTAFNAVSMGLDIAAQIRLDPTALMLRSSAATREASRLFSTVDDAAVTAERAGLIRGRFLNTVHGPTAESWLSSEAGLATTRYVDDLVRDPAGLTVVHDFLTSTAGKELPIVDTLNRLRSGTSYDTLARELVNGGMMREVPGSTSRISRGLARAATRGTPAEEFAATIGTKLGFRRLTGRGGFRQLREMQKSLVSVEDADDRLRTLSDFMVAGKYDDAARGAWMGRWLDLGQNPSSNDVFHLWREFGEDFSGRIGAEFGWSAAEAKALWRPISEYADSSMYMSDFTGRPPLYPGSRLEMMADGTYRAVPGPVVSTEMLGHDLLLPDPRELRRAVGVLAPLRQQAPWLFRASDPLGRFRLLLPFDIVTKGWKWLHLLRPALPMRVIPEEQLRMAALGFDSMFSHPLSYIAWVAGNDGSWLGQIARRLGVPARGRYRLLKYTDEAAALRALEKADPEDVLLTMADHWQETTSRAAGHGALTGIYRDPRQRSAWRAVAGNSKEGMKARTHAVARLSFDPLARRIAADGVESAKLWLRSPEGQALMRAKMGVNATTDKIFASSAAMDRWAEMVDGYIDNLAGRNVIPMIDGRAIDTAAIPADWARAIENGEWSRISYARGPEPWEPSIRQMIATGRTPPTELLPNGLKISSGEGIAESYRAIGEALDGMADGFRGTLIPAPATPGGSWKGMMDRGVDALFDHTLGRRTDILSRFPMFNQKRWQRLEEILPLSSAKVQRQIITSARVNKLPKATIARMEQVAARGAGVGIDDFHLAEDLAGTYATSEVKTYLYDLSRRHQIMDILGTTLPFGEVTVEVMGTWARILRRAPVAVRRAQQLYEGLSEQGIIFPDPQTGELVFQAPLLGPLLGLVKEPVGPTGWAGLVGLQSMNLVASSPLPGGGLFAQYGLSRFIPKSWPTFLRSLVLPYGDVTVDSPGAIVDQMLPAWFRKVLASVGVGSPESNQQIMSLTHNILMQMVASAPTEPQNMGEINAMAREANSIANRVTFIRGIVQAIMPAAFSPTFRTEDALGRVWYSEALAEEWSNAITRYDGDELAAYEWFLRAFCVGEDGQLSADWLDPTTFVGRTVEIVKRPLTVEGNRYAYANADLFETVAPLTAYFAHPDEPEELDANFSMAAWKRWIDEGARATLTPAQAVIRRNQTMGAILYERATRMADNVWGLEPSGAQLAAKQAWLREQRLILATRYYGYRQTNPGVPSRPDLGMLIREFQTEWVGPDADPRLAQSQAGIGVTMYMAMRDAALQHATTQLGLSTGDDPSGAENGMWQAQSARFLRNNLRTYGENLVAQYPDFGFVWRLILAYEFPDEEMLPSQDSAPYTDPYQLGWPVTNVGGG